MKKRHPLIQAWAGYKLPGEYIFLNKKDRPESLFPLTKIYILRWFVHPIKRRVAKYYLAFLRGIFGLKVIGITGSAGKTTTKEMVASILAEDGETVKSYANVDPVYNIPTTILRCSPLTKYLVLEMGVEYKGEMDFYLWLARPDVGVITNIFPTHTEFFEDADGVFEEKSKLVKNLSKEGVAILNCEDDRLKSLDTELSVKTIYFGNSTDIHAQDIVLTASLEQKFELVIDKEKVKIELPLVGRQFISNTLASAAVAKALGADAKKIKKGLEEFEAPEHRMRFIRLKSGTVVIDDSYNNNPEAAKAALETLSKIAGKKEKIVVFGDMLELGELEEKYHRELGNEIAKYKPSLLIGVGKASKYLTEEAEESLGKDRVVWVRQEKEALFYLEPYLDKETVILIKGSRSIGLDKLIDRLS